MIKEKKEKKKMANEEGNRVMKILQSKLLLKGSREQ